ncbi:MAG: hypothetical protein KJ907_14365 [Actinobacteria bacterium]|nr:hypothetical protein [Actinomycetota bacterium]MCG2680397.1 hypothetical protein [Kiritimatiellia bacterium]
MAIAEDMKNIAEDVISSYETRLQSIGAIFDSTHQLLEGFQNSFLETSQEREQVNTELRENLAKNESLRRKDFDAMIHDILSAQDERRAEVKNKLNTYVNEQKEMARNLSANLAEIKGSLAKGDGRRIRDFQAFMKETLARQDERKNEVAASLKEFQQYQRETAGKLRELAAKGRELRIKDLKSMLKEFKVQERLRIARQEERREAVHNMLGDFKKERMQTVKTWQDLQKIMEQRRFSLRSQGLATAK